MVTKAQIDQLKALDQSITRTDIENFLTQQHILIDFAQWNSFLNEVRLGTANTLWNPDSHVYQAVDAIVNNQGIMTQQFNNYYAEIIELDRFINENPINNFEDHLHQPEPQQNLITIAQLEVQGREINGISLMFEDY